MTIEKQMSSKESQYPHLYNEAEKIEKLLLNKDVQRDLDGWKITGLDKCI